MKIGVFDSGIGGISILKAIFDKLPHNEYFYLADNRNLPYGSKKAKDIIAFSQKNVETLIKKGVEIIVVGCNTSTAISIDGLRKNFEIPIVGTEPNLKNAKGKVCFLATPLTLSSQRVCKLMENDLYIVPDVSTLATQIEDYFPNIFLLEQEIKNLKLNEQNCDCIVLGCTHYNFIKELLAKEYPNITIFDSLSGVANRVKCLYDTILKSKETQKKFVYESESTIHIIENTYSNNKLAFLHSYFGNCNWKIENQ